MQIHLHVQIVHINEALDFQGAYIVFSAFLTLGQSAESMSHLEWQLAR